MIPRAKRRDPNEAEIVAALRAVGASVTPLHEPVDLLVGFRGKNYLLEVKRPPGKYGGTSESGQKLNKNQVKFFDEWRGQVRIVTSVADALLAIDAVVDVRC